MKIKICGIFREEDITYINEAKPDFAGFVFAQSRRQVSAATAAGLRRLMAEGIIPVGVFVNAPPEIIISLYRDRVISLAQLHGNESDEYIIQLKEGSVCGNFPLPVPVIKTIKSDELERGAPLTAQADYILIDSGAGSGKIFNWNLLRSQRFKIPWFLAGGISLENID